MRNKYFTLVIFGLILLGIISYSYYQQNRANSGEIKATVAPLGVRTKSTECKVNGTLPDKSCTPGTIFSSATKDQICTKGYSSQVRNVSESTKSQVYLEYGITSHTTGEYEVDHYISLELGGSNDIANLWPEAASPPPGFHEKDKVENFLHDQVCSGKISLSDAQLIIANNWVSIYDQIK